MYTFDKKYRSVVKTKCGQSQTNCKCNILDEQIPNFKEKIYLKAWVL